MSMITVSIIILVIIIVLTFWMNSGTSSRDQVYNHHHFHRDAIQQEKRERPLRHLDQKQCDWMLNEKNKFTVESSEPINERPSFVDFHPSCQAHPTPNPDLALSGTGVGLPAYEDVNEFPAEFKKSSQKFCGVKLNKLFEPKPRDEFGDESFERIEYKVDTPPVGGTVCKRNSGVGRPSFENEGEDFATY